MDGGLDHCWFMPLILYFFQMKCEINVCLIGILGNWTSWFVVGVSLVRRGHIIDAIFPRQCYSCAGIALLWCKIGNEEIACTLCLGCRSV